MKVKEFNNAVEELMVHYDVRKQEYVAPSGLIKDSDRYYRLDGISEGLQMAWHIFNKTKRTAEMIGDYDEQND
jgi:hypothetical protein